jgi:hypothetical protein
LARRKLEGLVGHHPPYHTPVRFRTTPTSIAMSGGTTFHFVTDGIQAPAHEVMGGLDVRLGGG